MARHYTKSGVKCFEPGQNVNLWLHRLDIERQLSQWADSAAVAEATMLMGDVALTWYLNNCNENITWAEFTTGMKQRFGDREQAIVAHIRHRKQGQHESVQSYIDEMSMLCSQAFISDSMKMDLILDNLNPCLKEQVLASIPKTLEQVIANATFLEDRLGSTHTRKAQPMGAARCIQQQQEG